MKLSTKRIAMLFMLTLCAVTLFGCVYFLPSGTAAAQTSPFAAAYFYDTLADENGNSYTLAKKFYEAIDEMHRTGDFKDGRVSYSLTEHDILTSSEIKAYAQDGDITAAKAFSAARDAYFTDHPELFYIDFYKMTISVGRSGSSWTAYIDSGREADLYHDNGFTSEQAVNSAIAQYEAKVDEIAAAAVAESEADVYGNDKKVLQAGYVNRYLASSENVEYDYGAYNEYLETGSTSSAASINTAYGALVVGKAVCGGYARAFKAVMDRLEIPCLVVCGYGFSKDENGNMTERSVYHAWNYVWYKNPVSDEEDDNRTKTAASDEGQWYAVDSTWNSSSRNKSRYMNMGELSLTADHIIDGVISSSGYELKYPALSSYNYGCMTDSDGLVHGITYEPYISEAGTPLYDDFGNMMMKAVETISYNGKSAKAVLEEDGLHLAYRLAYIDKNEETGEAYVKWTCWQDLSLYIKNGVWGNTDELDDGRQTVLPGNASTLYTQVAIMETGGDLRVNPDYEYGYDAGDFYFYREDEAHDPGEYMSAISEMLTNKTYGTYAPAPYLSDSSPSCRSVIVIADSMRDSEISDKVMMDLKYAQYYEVTYDEDLHVIDETQPIGISWISQHSNAGRYAQLLPLEDGSFVQLKEDKRTLRFRFIPSLMYEHNGEAYTFMFSNIGSCQERFNDKGEPYITNKAPNPVRYRYARNFINCSACFGDGRLWIDCCAQPTLISNSDLSEVDFRDENGNIYSEQQLSQMMLVVNSVNKEIQDAMLDDIDSNKNIDLKKTDIKASETYDVNLQICGKYPTIPNGSYVKIALGFPEGYGPEDEGVTFRLYHYKHDRDGNYIGVEEIPCVVTQFGIVATVTSFSPYMVAVVPADKAPTVKTVFAEVEGKGGSLNNADGQIRSLKKGESYTYTVQPKEGYRVYKLLLNGQDVTSRVSDGKLTLRYAELLNHNELQMQFIAEEAAQRFEEMGIVEPVKLVVSTEGKPVMALSGDRLAVNRITLKPDKGNVGLIVGISAAAVVLVCLVVWGVILIRKRNETN